MDEISLHDIALMIECLPKNVSNSTIGPVSIGNLTGTNNVKPVSTKLAFSQIRDYGYTYALTRSYLDSDNNSDDKINELCDMLNNCKYQTSLDDAAYMSFDVDNKFHVFLMFKDKDTAFRLRLMIGF